MSQSIRAKFRCTSMSNRAAHGKGVGVEQTEVELTAVMGDENKPWSKWTPSGVLKMSITNPDAVASIELGREYWIDLTPCE